MKDETEPVRPPAAPTTFCRRLQRMLPVDEHQACPYCFGGATDIAGGSHDRFCDFKPGVDPIQFGFPPDTSRNLEP